METVNSFDIEVMAGGKKNYEHNKLKNDPDFPQPIIEQKGFPSVWFKKDIDAYLAKQAAKPKAPCGRHAAKLQERRHSIDLTLALQFITASQLTKSHLNASRHTRRVLNQSRQNKEPVC